MPSVSSSQSRGTAPLTPPEAPTRTRHSRSQSTPELQTAHGTSESMRQQVQQSRSRTGSLSQLADQGQAQELGQKLKGKSSKELVSQAHELESALGQTAIGGKMSRASRLAAERAQGATQAVGKAKAVVKSGQETATAFRQVQKQPSAENLAKLGKKLDKHEKALESALSEVPGGKDAIKSAKKSLGKGSPLRQLAEVPGVKHVVETVKDGSRAYKDIQACIKDPSVGNVGRATCSGVKAGATATVAVTAGLVAVGVISAPVSVPILAVGAAIGGIAACIRGFFSKSEPKVEPKPEPRQQTPTVSKPVTEPQPEVTRSKRASAPEATEQTGETHRSHRSRRGRHAREAAPSAQETSQAFKKLHKEPSAENLQALGGKLKQQEKALESAVSDLPGGKDAVKAAKKALGKANPLKAITEAPVVKAVTTAIKDGSKAYKDVQTCVKDPSVKNVAKATSSGVKVGATATVAVTAGLVAVGVVSAPVSVPIIAIGAAIGGVAALFRKWLG